MTESTGSMAGFRTSRGTEITEQQFGQSSSTREDLPTPARRPDSNEPPGLAEWLATPEASQLVGQWVLLTRDYEVIDYAPAPSELFERHPDNRSPFIVFVRPRNTRYAR
jgi:hypothetical protein